MGEGPVSQARPSFRVLRCHGRGTQAKVYKTVVSDCGPRTAAEDASALGILKPLEFDLRPISSLLATQAFNPNGHLPAGTASVGPPGLQIGMLAAWILS